MKQQPRKRLLILCKRAKIHQQRQPRGAVETPPKVLPLNDLDSAKCRIFILSKLQGNMKARIIYDLETRVRKERKRIATENCRRWQMYYDAMTGERFAVPCLTREHIKATTLPPTNNGQPTITRNLW